MAEPHRPVLITETLTALNLQPNQHAVDCTIGAGGHAESILQQTGPRGQLLGLDVDPKALAIAQARLAPFDRRVQLVQANFEGLETILTGLTDPLQPIRAILADLGVSSMQLDQPERGFSFMQDGPLDMRMGPDAAQAAERLVNTLAEGDLANLIYRYGQERKSRRIARTIVKARPLRTTGQLAEVVLKAIGRRRTDKIHPATRTFQALRIAVNDELGALERFLPQAIRILSPGGRLGIISFHSLEDRIVKHFFRQEAKDCICPPEQLICICNHQATVEIITKKPIFASKEEKNVNRRARSARLRVVEVKG